MRLIDGLVEDVDKIKKIGFKKVQNNQIGELYLEEDTTYGFECHNSLGGCLTFKEIEYLIFPKVVDREAQLEQDLDQIKKLLESIGQLSLEIDDNRVKLICYRE